MPRAVAEPNTSIGAFIGTSYWCPDFGNRAWKGLQPVGLSNQVRRILTRIIQIAYVAPYFHDFSFFKMERCQNAMANAISGRGQSAAPTRAASALTEKKPEITARFL